MLKIGFVGFDKKTNTFIQIIDNIVDKVEYSVYAPGLLTQVFASLKYVDSIEKLFECDAILLTTQSYSNYEYMKILLTEYSGYILCEKSPFSEKAKYIDLISTCEGKQNKILFNFNNRFGPYALALKSDVEKYSLGKLTSVSIVQGQGAALQECFLGSIINNREIYKQGVFENYSLHYIDLLVYFFGVPVEYVHFSSSMSKYSKVIDNSLFSCKFKNEATASIITSYTTPKVSIFNFVFENGIIEFGGDKKIYGPREFFDEEALFAEPPLILSERLPDDIYLFSLKRLLDYFIACIKEKDDIDDSLFITSRESMKFLFK